MDPAIEPMTDWRMEAHEHEAEAQAWKTRCQRLEQQLNDMQVVLDALGMMVVRMAHGSASPSPAPDVPGVAGFYAAGAGPGGSGGMGGSPSPPAAGAGGAASVPPDPGCHPAP
jgi:hypothetical protein